MDVNGILDSTSIRKTALTSIFWHRSGEAIRSSHCCQRTTSVNTNCWSGGNTARLYTNYRPTLLGEFESWWLVKALCPHMYRDGFSNAAENDFLLASQEFLTAYKDTRPEANVGRLQLVGPNEVGTAMPIDRRRIYG